MTPGEAALELPEEELSEGAGVGVGVGAGVCPGAVQGQAWGSRSFWVKIGSHKRPNQTSQNWHKNGMKSFSSEKRTGSKCDL